MYRKEIFFSNRQLDILKRKMQSEKKYAFGPKKRQQRSDEIQIRCRDCTAEPVSEMLCTHCDTHKEIDSFARAQRKKPDNAVSCWPASLTLVPVERGILHLTSFLYSHTILCLR